jgi:hypothetical protein
VASRRFERRKQPLRADKRGACEQGIKEGDGAIRSTRL